MLEGSGPSSWAAENAKELSKQSRAQQLRPVLLSQVSALDPTREGQSSYPISCDGSLTPHSAIEPCTDEPMDPSLHFCSGTKLNLEALV